MWVWLCRINGFFSRSELQQRNFEIHLADVEQYGNELDKRDKKIQGLMFKMKKDLERQNNATPINSDNTEGV